MPDTATHLTLPGFSPAPQRDPLHDACVTIEESGHPDADAAIAALDALAAALDKIRAVATGAAETAVRRAAETAARDLRETALEVAGAWADDASDYAAGGWRRYCDEADRAYQRRLDRQEARQ